MKRALSSSITSVITQLNNSLNDEDAYICNRETFSSIYKLEQRRAERHWHQVIFSRVKIKGINLLSKDLEAVSSKLKKALKEKVRHSDAICQWAKDQFALLLFDIAKSDMEKVVKRVNDFYYRDQVFCQENNCWFNLDHKCKKTDLREGESFNCEHSSDQERVGLKWEYTSINQEI